LMFPDLNRLKVFFHVYECGGIKAAADALHITQSAVSQHLGKLEGELNLSLFTRLSKRMVPTPAGQRLFEIFQPFLHDLTRGIKELQHARNHPAGELRIGAPVEFGENVLPEIIAAFRKPYPDVVFRLDLGHPTLLLPRLLDGSLDFAFADIFSRQAHASRDLAPFHIEPVFDEELAMVCSWDYNTEVLGDDHGLSALCRANFIAYRPHAPAVRSWFRHHFETAALRLNVVLTVESVQAVIQGVRHHLGLGVVPSHIIEKELRAGTVVQIVTGRPELVNQISLIQILNKVPSITEKRFIAFFRENWSPAAGRLTLSAPSAEPRS